MPDEISDFLAEPNGENFLRVRAMIEASSTYGAGSDGDERLAAMVEQGDYVEAQDFVGDLMPDWLLSPRVHRLAAEVAENLGDEEGAARARYMLLACTRGILLAGEGTRERPFPVLHASDEYEILDVMGKEPVDQRLVPGEEGPCDVIRCSDDSEVWFDNSAGLSAAAEEFRAAQRA
jgi:hypothetical protein